MGELCYSIEEAARRLGISKRHLIGLLHRGDGPPVVRLGRRVMIRPAALAAWLDAREGAGNARRR